MSERFEVSIENPEHMLISDEGNLFYGCNQEWFSDNWQRRAGCGPCTAATILYYFSRRPQRLDCLYPSRKASRDAFVCFMDEIWQFVTPGAAGVNEASMLIDGMLKFADQCNISLKPALYCVPAIKRRTDPFSELMNFLQTGLAADSPVAFLNLSNGQLANLDSWHWVTITAVSAGDAVISDSGERKIVNLALWYETSLLGGAFVWFDIPEVIACD